MANDPGFVTFALDLLAPLGPVHARAMFGGHGLYARGVMFGLLDDDELFLKTDAACRARFVEAGCRQWVYVSKTQRMESTSYFRPPDEAHEDAEAMLPWARLALDAALRTQAARASRAARAAPTAARPAAATRSRAASKGAKGRAAAGKRGARRPRGRARAR